MCSNTDLADCVCPGDKPDTLRRSRLHHAPRAGGLCYTPYDTPARADPAAPLTTPYMQPLTYNPLLQIPQLLLQPLNYNPLLQIPQLLHIRKYMYM